MGGRAVRRLGCYEVVKSVGKEKNYANKVR